MGMDYETEIKISPSPDVWGYFEVIVKYGDGHNRCFLGPEDRVGDFIQSVRNTTRGVISLDLTELRKGTQFYLLEKILGLGNYF